MQFLFFSELKKIQALKGLHKMFDKALLDHIVINVKSRMKMVDFYCNVLGFSVERNIPAMTQLKLGSILIDLLEAESVDDDYNAGKNIDHFCLRVSPFDCDDIIEHFKKAGVRYEKPDHRYGASGFGTSIYFYDVEDNKVELKAL